MKFYKSVTCILSFMLGLLLAKSESSLYTDPDWIITKSKAVYQNTEIYNSNKLFLDLKKSEETPECKVEYSFNCNPLSLVGHYFSYEVFASGYYGCGVPSSAHQVMCINVSDMQPVLLTDCFTEKSILKAFKSDPWIKTENEYLAKAMDTVSTIKSLTSVLKNIGMNTRFDMSGFAISKYDTSRNLAAVRLVGSQYMGFDHSAPLQLGLWLEPTSAFKNILRTEIKFLFGKYKNDLY